MNALVLVAGGSGRRMGGSIPKQYAELAGKPVILHTLEKFHRFDPGIRVVLVVAESHREYWDAISRSYPGASPAEVVIGGATRFDSVKNGLERIEDGMIVGIHDAVRPLVSLDTLGRCYRAAARTGSAVPVMEMDVSVRRITGPGRSENLDRNRLRQVQTPQVFRSEWIREAYRNRETARFTDDASLYEAYFGREVTLVEGNRENIKITTPVDLRLATLLI